MSHLCYPKYSISAPIDLDETDKPTLMFRAQFGSGQPDSVPGLAWNLNHYAGLLDEHLPDWKQWAERVKADPSAPIPDHIEQAVRDVFRLPAEDAIPTAWEVHPDSSPKMKEAFSKGIDPSSLPVVVRHFLAHFSTAHDVVTQPQV